MRPLHPVRPALLSSAAAHRTGGDGRTGRGMGGLQGLRTAAAASQVPHLSRQLLRSLRSPMRRRGRPVGFEQGLEFWLGPRTAAEPRHLARPSGKPESQDPSG